MTTRESQRHTATLLYRKRTTAGSVVSFGTEKTGDDRDASPMLKCSELTRTNCLNQLILLILFCLMSVDKNFVVHQDRLLETTEFTNLIG